MRGEWEAHPPGHAFVTTLVLTLAVLLLAAPAAVFAKRGDKAKIEALSEKYQQWLAAVEPLISKEERAAFLELEKDYQRDAFVKRFWDARDPYPRTSRNELRETFEARIEEALTTFGRLDDDRTRIFLMNGTPTARLEIDCTPGYWPMEVWHYKGSDLFQMEFLLLFYQQWARGQFRLWEPSLGLDELRNAAGGVSPSDSAVGGGRFGLPTSRELFSDCGKDADAVRAALSFISGQGGELGAMTFLSELMRPRQAPPKEWVASFDTYSTDLPEDAATFDATLEISYPGRYQTRTVLQGTVAVPLAEIGVSQLGEHAGSYDLMLNGEVLREGELFENFRYRFDFGQDEVTGDTLPLVFQRYLRPGEYRLILKVEDVASQRFFRTERDLDVPMVDQAPPSTPQDPETARLLAEATAAIRSGETTLQVIPLQGEWQTGLVRIDTLTTGPGIDKVTFYLDGQPILTKKSPPYNVELDLGQVPRTRELQVVAYGSDGEEVASDEELLNTGPHRFGVRLVEPQRGKSYRHSLRAEAEVQAPEGEVVERVELYLNETLVATLYQPPYVQPILLPGDETIAYVRAVAYTPDGAATEDLVFVNAPDNLEEIDVDFVELYTVVLDRDNRPVEGLDRDDFTVLEDGVPQTVARFEVVENLPIHAAIVLDVSASMAEELAQAQQAAVHFFEQAITPKDRAAVVTFNDHPQLVAKFTNDVEALAGDLAGLKAERGTALYDSLIFTLYYFNGIRGQRAILLLSDGKDESSRFSYDDAMEYARRAGVSIYAIGLKLPRTELEARRKLSRLAEETGGRSFFVDESSELEAIYAAIQHELRSRYLLGYQSNNVSGSKKFRAVEVTVKQPGLEAKTLRGYYPD